MDESKVDKNRLPEPTKQTAKKGYRNVEEVRAKLKYKRTSSVYHKVRVGDINVIRRGGKGNILAYCFECVEALSRGENHDDCTFHVEPNLQSLQSF